jgi:putative FmdB family regulatory protein
MYAPARWYNISVPIYEYICDDCETRFERIVINKQQEIACPKCASKKNTIQLSVFATSNGSGNGASAKSSTSFSGGGGSCCGGGCGCH